MIYKPQFDSPGSDSISKKYDRVPDVDSVFSIHPPTGVLPPAENMEFKITYAPPIVSTGKYRGMLSISVFQGG